MPETKLYLCVQGYRNFRRKGSKAESQEGEESAQKSSGRDCFDG